MTTRRTAAKPAPSTDTDNIALALELLRELQKRAEAQDSPARPYWTKLKSTRFQALLGMALTAATGVLDGRVSAEDGLLAVAAVAVAYIAGKSVEHMAEIWAKVNTQK